MKRNIRCLFFTIITLSVLSSAWAQTTWSWRNPKPQGNDLNAVATDGAGHYVGVGAYGTVVTAVNGANWASQTTGVTSNLYGVTYSADFTEYVTVGQGGFISSSPNGTNWTVVASGVTNDLTAVTYGNGLFVAVGLNGTLLTSEDGVSWSPANSKTTSNLRAVCFDGTAEYAAVGDNGAVVQSSGYGTAWTAQSLGSTNYFYGVTFTPNSTIPLILVGWNSGASTNAALAMAYENQLWIPYNNTGNANPLRSVCYSAGTLVSVGDNGTILTSANYGLSWNAITSGAGNKLTAVVNGGQFIAAGQQGIILSSPDGLNWQSQLAGFPNNLNTVLYTGTNFLGVGTAGLYFTSPDGSAWTSNSIVSNDLYGAVKAFGKTVLTGTGGEILVSTNGKNWMQPVSPTVNNLTAVAASTNLFAAVGAAGTILTSPDGSAWCLQTNSLTTGLNAVTWGNGLFVTVGVSGKIATSPDGTNWTTAASGTANVLNGVAYGTNRFVAVGLRGKIVTSTNGSIWTSSTSPTSQELQAVIYDGVHFVAVGLSGTVLTSLDGLTWSNQVVKTTAPLLSVAFGNNTYVAVGNNGTILSAPSVNPNPPVITSAASATGTVNVDFSYQITALNSPTNYGATGLPAGLSLNITNGLISGIPEHGGVFTVTLSSTNSGGIGSASLVLTIMPSVQTVALWDIGSQTYGINDTLMGDASSGLPVTFAVISGPASISGDQLDFYGAGLVTVQAIQMGSADYLPATNTLAIMVNKATQNLTFNYIGDHTYGDGPITLSASSSSDLPITFTVTSGWATVSSNLLTINAAGPVTVQAIQAGNTNYYSQTASQTFNVARASQSISFGSLADHTYGDAPIPLFATASSGLAVSFAVSSGYATVIGTNLTINAAGPVTVLASQAGNSNYLNATSVSQSFNVAKSPQTISFTKLPDKLRSDAPFTLSATASSLLPVTFSILSGPATLTGNTVSLTGVGTVAVQAVQSGNTNYLAAANVNQNFNVAIGVQTLTFTNIPSHVYGDTPFALGATASSGLPVSYAVVSGPATLQGDSLQITGTGSVTVRALQAGNTEYLPATNVEHTFAVSPKAQIITFTNIPNQPLGSGPLVLTAAAGSGLPVTLTLLNSGTASLAGNLLYLTNIGTVYLRASQAGDANWQAAANVDQSFQITNRTQTITFDILTNRPMTLVPIPLHAVASSGLPVSFQVSGPATLKGNMLGLFSTGTVSVVASQPGNAIYNAAAKVTNSFLATKTGQTITFPAITNRFVDNSPVVLNATASSGLPVTYSVTGPASLTGNLLCLTSTGTVSITASQVGNTNFLAAPDTNQTFTVSKRTQTITFSALPNHLMGDAPFALGATANSGLPVTYTLVAGAGVVTLQGNVVTLTGPGTVTIQADQAGNAYYAGATAVSRTFTNYMQTQSITFSAITNRFMGDAPVVLDGVASSGLPITYSVTGPASLAGNLLYLTSTGTVSVTASQAGNAIFVATNKMRSFSVSQRNQTIVFDTISNCVWGDAPFQLHATASSGLPVVLTLVSNTPSLAGNLLTPNSEGLATVRASQPGNVTYTAATPVDQTFRIYGTNWYPVAIATTSNIVDAAFGNGIFMIAVGDGIWTSPDGLYWKNTAASVQFPSLSKGQNRLTYGNGMFVSFLGANILSSPDGSNWVASASSPNSLSAITFGDGRFVAVDSSWNFFISTNGTNWNVISSSLSSYSPDGFIAAGNGAVVCSISVWVTSAQYYNYGMAYWSDLSMAGNSWIGPVSMAYRPALGYGGEKFEWTGNVNGKWLIYQSTNGLAWNTNANPYGSTSSYTHNFYKVVPTDIDFVLLRNDLLLSPWSPNYSHSSALNGGAFGKNRVIVVGNSGTALLSSPCSTVLPAVPAITSSPIASGAVGSSFSYQIASSPAATLFGADGLPQGLSLNPTNGLISGTPGQFGTFPVLLTAANSGGVGSQNLTISIGAYQPAPVITSGLSVSGVFGQAFSYQITAANNPTNFAASSLPAGLTLDATTGLISGTPTNYGSFSIQLAAGNGTGFGITNITLTINLNLPLAPAITSASNALGVVGSPFSYQITADNGPQSYQVTGLPPGLGLTNGWISGTPAVAGNYPVQLSAINAGGVGSQSLSITIANVAQPGITSATSTNGVLNTSFSYQITSSNNPTLFGAAGLPGNLTVNPATGLITGMPTNAGVFVVTLSAANGGGAVTGLVTITIPPLYLTAPIITSALTMTGAVNVAFSYQITAANSPVQFGAVGLPPGLTVNETNGQITGVPLSTNIWPVIITAANPAGVGTNTLQINIGVIAPPVITSGTATNGIVNTAFSYQITASNAPVIYGAAGLPGGITLNTGTGLIVGTPTNWGTFPIALSAANAGGVGTAMLNLSIPSPLPAMPVITSATNAVGNVGTLFNYQIIASGTPTSYAADPVPNGLGFNAISGRLSGSMTNTGTYLITISAANAGGAGSAVLYINVANGGSNALQFVASSLVFSKGAFTFSATGPTGSNAVISASTNLQTWVPLVTNLLGNGTFNFTDSLATNYLRRYYRATLLP